MRLVLLATMMMAFQMEVAGQAVAIDSEQARLLWQTNQPAYFNLVMQHIGAAGQRYGVDPDLVVCVFQQESGFNPHALSPAGARGIAQFMPGTARRFGLRVDDRCDDRLDPVKSTWAAVEYLAVLQGMFGGRSDLALAGYNAGEQRVIDAGYQVPRITETQSYVRAILGHYHRRKAGGGSFRAAPGAAPAQPPPSAPPPHSQVYVPVVEEPNQ